jgi:hypothetical protein
MWRKQSGQWPSPSGPKCRRNEERFLLFDDLVFFKQINR